MKTRAVAAWSLFSQPKANVVPDRCSIFIDRRLVPGEDPAETTAEIRAIAEQAIAGVVGGVAVAGQIDRLAVTAEAIVFVDFKTNRMPPRSPERTPLAYLRQMAAYQALLRRLWPDREIRAALVWTETCSVTWLRADLLDSHLTFVGEHPGTGVA